MNHLHAKRCRTAALAVTVVGIACGAFATTQTAAAVLPPESGNWVGTFICVTDDVTELSDGDRARGHTYFDLDGDASDSPVSMKVSVGSDGAFHLQGVFAGQPTSDVTDFFIMSTTESERGSSMIGISKDQGWGQKVAMVMYERDTGKYGLSIVSSSYSTPAMRGGETFVMVDVRTAHCTHEQ